MATGRLVTLFLVSWSISLEVCAQSGPAWLIPPTESHPCQRPCEEGKTMTCYYKFSVEIYLSLSKACYDCPKTLADCYREDCVAVDGIMRTVIVVNRQLPGPTIEVCLGDKVVVDVENLMNDQSTSIHWHGHHQVKSPYMDGVPFITQCPIDPNTVFRYIMYATNKGTHFWHSHTGMQRGDGVFGPLIVKEPDATDNLRPLYDQDLSEHVIIVNDWTNIPDTDKIELHLHSFGNNKPDTILVNGRGRYYNDSVARTKTPLAVFTVKKGLRYRFRLINSGLHNCPQDLNIDNHNITAIASDGYNFEPVVVDSLVSYAGERWDFVLVADQPVDNYWIRFTGLMDCDERFNKVHQVAVLHYEGAPVVEPSGPVGYGVHPKSTLQLNALNVGINQTGTLSVPKLNATKVSEDTILLKEKPDIQFVLFYDFSPVDHPMYHKTNAYGFKEVNSTYQRYTPQFNYVSFKMPHHPLLSQNKDNDPDQFCSNQNIEKCNNTFCECTYVMKIPTNSCVELILIDKGVVYNANHPFHLHGYAFRVVGMDRLGESVDVETVKALDKQGKLVRNLDHPPYKDTVTVPDGGYTILRFRATNPGYWLLHCHIEAHVEVGMAVVFKVGEDVEYPPKPDGFPTCGDFSYSTPTNAPAAATAAAANVPKSTSKAKRRKNKSGLGLKVKTGV